MRPSITDRYEKNADGITILDVTINKIEELYDRFDIVASYKKKDLNEEFTEYLLECANELKKEPFLLRINLLEANNEAKNKRLKSSIRHYFTYLRELELREIQKHLTRAAYSLSFGIIMVFLSFYLDSHYKTAHSIITDISIEGITIVAWVSVWEASTNLIFKWGPHYKKRKLYGKIANSEVQFRQIQQQ